MTFLEVDDGHVARWSYPRAERKYCHQFDREGIRAVNAALAADRPLLIRGEPGVGKSQLAEAAAWELGRAFLRHVVDARTEARDLLWRFDAVARLADAQVIGQLPDDRKKSADGELLPVSNYVRPGPLWWALNDESAAKHTRSNNSPLRAFDNENRKDKGWVLLIDEIDKAEADVPNGLLEALGAREFWPIELPEPVVAKREAPAPLVIVTTNEERILPDAFVRRCMVLHLGYPKDLAGYLVSRGQAHFQDRVDPQVLSKAAELTVKDRKRAEELQLSPLPGQAEFIDLVTAVENRAKDREEQIRRIEELAQYALVKHPELL